MASPLFKGDVFQMALGTRLYERWVENLQRVTPPTLDIQRSQLGLGCKDQYDIVEGVLSDILSRVRPISPRNIHVVPSSRRANAALYMSSFWLHL